MNRRGEGLVLITLTWIYTAVLFIGSAVLGWLMDGGPRH